MSSVFHKPDVFGGGVYALAVLDGSLEHVGELRLVPEEVGPDPVDHAPVLHQVVLQGVAGQHHPPPGADLLQSLQKILSENQKYFIHLH